MNLFALQVNHTGIRLVYKMNETNNGGKMESIETKNENKYAIMCKDFGHRLTFLAANLNEANEILYNWINYHGFSHKDFWVTPTTRYEPQDFRSFKNK
jgi:hypothetical protein